MHASQACLLALATTSAARWPMLAARARHGLQKQGFDTALVARPSLRMLNTHAPRRYESGETAECECAADPFLKAEQWRMCRCPEPKPLHVPTIEVRSGAGTLMAVHCLTRHGHCSRCAVWLEASLAVG